LWLFTEMQEQLVRSDEFTASLFYTELVWVQIFLVELRDDPFLYKLSS